MLNKKCEQCGKRVAWIGIWANLIMVVIKIWVGLASCSKACIADGLHSGSNIITAFAIMLSHKLGSRKRDGLFHFGYGKIEFLAAGFITLLIISGAVFLISISIKHLVNEPQKPPHLSALLMACISIGANEMLFRYMRCVGTQMKSQTVMANAWANRADCFSSLAVIIGVIGSKMGLNHLDPIAALFVVAIIIKVSASILVDSVKALMDTSVNEQYGEEIATILSSFKEIQGVKKMRTRQMGQKIWADIDIFLDSQCSMGEAQNISMKVKNELTEKVGDLERVLVNHFPMERKQC